MINKEARDIDGIFDDNITKVLDSISELDPNSQTETMSDQVKLLGEVVRVKNEYNKPKNELIQKITTIGGTLLGIGAMLAFEQNGVITSKAMSFIPKPRI